MERNGEIPAPLSKNRAGNYLLALYLVKTLKTRVFISEIWNSAPFNLAPRALKASEKFKTYFMHHFKLLFINEYGVERLLSMGEDRKLVEYVIEDKARVANFITDKLSGNIFINSQCSLAWTKKVTILKATYTFTIQDWSRCAPNLSYSVPSPEGRRRIFTHF